MSKKSRAKETGEKLRGILLELYEADPEGAADARVLSSASRGLVGS